MEDRLKSRTIAGLSWRMMQSVCAQLVNFILQLILARLLLPEDYGIVSMAAVFITLANVFVQTGFTSAVIQQETLSEQESASAFWGGMLLSAVLFTALFFSAPAISSFYGEPVLVDVLRVQAINLPVLALCSVQLALLTRELQYKKSFFASLTGYVVNGAAGIVMALLGMGVWALVVSTLVGNAVNCLLLILITRWLPRARPSFSAVRRVLSFSSKILAANLLNTLYNNMYNLIIGKAYSAGLLGYYSKGFQFPTVIMNNVDGVMNNVLFTTLSRAQNDPGRSKRIMRLSQRLSLFVTAPLMAGLFAAADAAVIVLLTERWLPAVPFLRVVCVICLFWPLSAKTQAINARGKSGVTLAFNCITKFITFGVMLYCKRFSIETLMLASMVAEIVNVLLYMPVVQKHLGYTVFEQMADLLGSVAPAVLMGALTYGLSLLLATPPVATLLIQLVFGAAFYIGFALVTKNASMRYLLDTLAAYRAKAKHAAE